VSVQSSSRLLCGGGACDRTINAVVVSYERAGHVAHITLRRPERLNAIDAAVNRELVDAVRRLDADPEARVGILAGEGRAFCAGADLGAVAAGGGEALGDGTESFAGFVSMARAKPVVAAVHGYALAGGLELALACDVVVAAAGTQFGLPEVTRGLVAAAGGAIRLPRLVPEKRALEIILTGRRFDAAEALALGLVSRVVAAEELEAAARELAEQIAGNAPAAVRASLQLVRGTRGMTEPEAWQRSATAWREVLATADAHEGAAAFLERREPQWSGR
jgi:enoyl-CoA hydratase